ncbi:MAG: hypothetical protein VW829_13620, partial [Deltaproteobacteria bacterium]
VLQDELLAFVEALDAVHDQDARGSVGVVGHGADGRAADELEGEGFAEEVHARADGALHDVEEGRLRDLAVVLLEVALIKDQRKPRLSFAIGKNREERFLSKYLILLAHLSGFEPETF